MCRISTLLQTISTFDYAENHLYSGETATDRTYRHQFELRKSQIQWLKCMRQFSDLYRVLNGINMILWALKKSKSKQSHFSFG